MDLKELLRLLIDQAQSNGFEFRPWYESNIRSAWLGKENALETLASEGRHFALVFSHDFVRYFWKTGAQISFTIPSATYPRVNSQGEVIVITRKPFTRRTIKADAWKYHLRQMAAAEDPIAYLCRFLPIQDQPPPNVNQMVNEALEV